LTPRSPELYNRFSGSVSEQHMYAIFRTGGKQYKVSPGDVIRVERLPGEPGSRVEFNHICAVRKESLTVGAPLVEKAKVVGTILRNQREPKIRVLKYKRKKQYRRTTGHRQPFSEVLIKAIVEA
jgi:large subunit ribosomal protein L21